MFPFKKKQSSGLAGSGYIILNIIRVFNSIALLTVAVGSWIMLVRTVETSNFYFFDGVSHFIASAIAIFLVVSELDIFRGYFEKNWPLLSQRSGFLFLGGAMVILGCNTLGNLNKIATSVQNLGLPLWRVVIAGGILSSIMGTVNIITSFIFRTSEMTARQVRRHGASKSNLEKPSESYTSPNLPSYHQTTENKRRSGLFRFPVRVSNLNISRPVPTDPEQFRNFESRASPVAPEIQRPPTALHPAYSPSRYSIASHVSRF